MAPLTCIVVSLVATPTRLSFLSLIGLLSNMHGLSVLIVLVPNTTTTIAPHRTIVSKSILRQFSYCYTAPSSRFILYRTHALLPHSPGQ